MPQFDQAYARLILDLEQRGLLARSHLLGVERHFYYGYGAGFKRLFVVSGAESGAELALPTLRLSIGYAF